MWLFCNIRRNKHWLVTISLFVYIFLYFFVVYNIVTCQGNSIIIGADASSLTVGLQNDDGFSNLTTNTYAPGFSYALTIVFFFLVLHKYKVSILLWWFSHSLCLQLLRWIFAWLLQGYELWKSLILLLWGWLFIRRGWNNSGEWSPETNE